MITQLLYLVLFTSLITLGWRIIISEGMGLESVGKHAEERIEVGSRRWKFLKCEWCLPSLFAPISLLVALSVNLMPFIFAFKYIVLVALAIPFSSLICGFTWMMYHLIDSKIEESDLTKDVLKEQVEYYKHAKDNAYFDVADRKRKHHEEKERKMRMNGNSKISY